ncbi:MAG: hypothetical protein LBL67_03810 [Coriobacteriales bacterium]|nr:hypothetical protein [Coriobacteriales bacterium]
MSIYDFKAQDNAGDEIALDDFDNQVLLVVNSAPDSRYGEERAALDRLYQKYQAQGFSILDFPCQQCLGQRDGSADQPTSMTDELSRLDQALSYPRFAPVQVNGPDAAPLFRWLKAHDGTRSGNLLGPYCKFLVDQRGEVVARYDSHHDPSEVEQGIAALLDGPVGLGR